MTRNIRNEFDTFTAILIGLAVAFGILAGVGALVPTPADATHGGAHCKVITHRGLLPNGTENQPNGVNVAADWGFAEVDADVDENGLVVAVHDAKLGRLTDGDLTGYVNQYSQAEMNASTVSHPFGTFRLTTTLIDRAADLNVPIMVTINRWTRIKDAGYANATLDTLYAAAQAHPRPELVYFGGYGSEDAMHARHPDAATFHRYENTDIQEEIYADVTADSVDLAALPTGYFQGQVVQAVRDAGASRVATRQLFAKRDALAAQAAGINTIQGNDAQQIATSWCE